MASASIMGGLYETHDVKNRTSKIMSQKKPRNERLDEHYLRWLKAGRPEQFPSLDDYESEEANRARKKPKKMKAK